MLTKMMTFPTDATAVSGGPMIFSFTQKFELKLRSFLSIKSSLASRVRFLGSGKPTKRHGFRIKIRFWWEKWWQKSRALIDNLNCLAGLKYNEYPEVIHVSYHWITSTLFLNDEMFNLPFGSSFFEWLAGFVHAAICQCLWSGRDSAGFISLTDSVIVCFFLGIFWLGCKVVDPHIV